MSGVGVFGTKRFAVHRLEWRENFYGPLSNKVRVFTIAPPSRDRLQDISVRAGWGRREPVPYGPRSGDLDVRETADGLGSCVQHFVYNDVTLHRLVGTAAQLIYSPKLDRELVSQISYLEVSSLYDGDVLYGDDCDLILVEIHGARRTHRWWTGSRVDDVEDGAVEATSCLGSSYC